VHAPPAGRHVRARRRTDAARTPGGRDWKRLLAFAARLKEARLQATASSDGPHACLRSGSEEEKPKQILYLFASPDHLPSPGLPAARDPARPGPLLHATTRARLAPCSQLSLTSTTLSSLLQGKKNFTPFHHVWMSASWILAKG
jgi:hypothetical protein